MAIKPSVISTAYVKFVRTTQAMYNALGANVDKDTLYFIIEEGSTSGKLYLGNNLIQGAASEGEAAQALAELEDIVFSGLADLDVLVYDAAAGKWKNRKLEDYIPGEFTGATEEEDGLAGLVPVPMTGDLGKFLGADGTWADPTAGLKVVVGTLIGEDTDKSVREIAATEVAKIVDDAPNKFDTLKEIAQWIGDADNTTAAEMVTDIASLKEILNGKEAVIENGEEIAPAIPGLLTKIGNLETLLNDENGLINIVADHDEAINTLQEALKWSTLIDEE